MIASLPMYDTVATRAANDRFWTIIRDSYGHGPPSLDRSSDPHDQWMRNDLVFSQTCGLPYRESLHDVVQLVGTPDYGLADCKPGYYRSHIVVRQTDGRQGIDAFLGARLARNDRRSQSGWAALSDVVSLDDVGDILDTGSHVNSMRAVASGRADYASIDAVTWALAARDTRETDDLRILMTTRQTPGLPYIAGMQEDADGLFHAIKTAISELSQIDREILMLKDLVAIPAANYLARS